MGAADVIPFIPIEGVTLADCVAMARHVGERDREALSDPGLSL
jgi:glutamate formiminotransferase